METMASTDPLVLLPPEVVLQILEFASISSVANLSALSQAWHRFIEQSHQEAIYSSESKVLKPPGAKDFSHLEATKSFAKYYSNVPTWKELCKRQTLLARSWNQMKPLTRESILQVGNDPVWRFRPDFKRRIFLSTSQAGGLNVTDMDTGSLLWRLPSTLDRDHDSVRPYAHLEYQDGVAVFDREGDAVEVWQTGLGGLAHGEFRQVAILPHDCQTRGFQLSYDTLCVVSTQGQGFVYDMTQRPPRLTTHLKIQQDAVGHLDQDEEVVVYSMGTRGYHIYNKSSGQYIGALKPAYCTRDRRFHIKHPNRSQRYTTSGRHGPTPQIFPPGTPRHDRLAPLKLEAGPLPPPSDPDHVWHGEDEWGAGMFCSDLFVGFSRAGRLFICPEWYKALRYPEKRRANFTIVECESDGSSFDLGGWLSVRDHRVMFEIDGSIYIVGLDDENRIPQDLAAPPRPSYSLLTSSAPQLSVPVSFMAVYDDCIMTTFTTLGWRQSAQPLSLADDQQQQENGPARIFPTKAIRIISLAPDSSEDERQSPVLWEPSAEPAEDLDRSRTGLLELVSMLGDELDDEDDEIGAMATDFHGDVE